MSTVPEVEAWPALDPTRDDEAPHSDIGAVQVVIFAAACATGSGSAPAVYALRGWTAVGGLGALFVVAALAYYSTEVRKSLP